MNTKKKPKHSPNPDSAESACIPFTESDYNCYVQEPCAALDGIAHLLREIETGLVEHMSRVSRVQALAGILDRSGSGFMELSERLRERFGQSGKHEQTIPFTREDLENYRWSMMPLTTASSIKGHINRESESEVPDEEDRSVAAGLKALHMIQIFLELAISRLDDYLCAAEVAGSGKKEFLEG